MSYDHTTFQTPGAIDYAPLLQRFGELMSCRQLMWCLGFRSSRSFARACRSETLHIPTFLMDGRRGRFARTRDVAAWLTALGMANAQGARIFPAANFGGSQADGPTTAPVVQS